jgi:hypothetical protein
MQSLREQPLRFRVKLPPAESLIRTPRERVKLPDSACYKEASMRMRISGIRIAAMVTLLAAAGTALCSASAQKMPLPQPQDNLAMGEDQVKQLLLLMPTDKNGMVSRQDYVKFMETEFDRLDKEKKGELDARRLAQSSLSASRFVGK